MPENNRERSMTHGHYGGAVGLRDVPERPHLKDHVVKITAKNTNPYSARACPARRHASAGLISSRDVPSLCTAKVTTAGRPALRMVSRASSASPTQLKVSAMTKSTPASAAQLTCSANADLTARSAEPLARRHSYRTGPHRCDAGCRFDLENPDYR
jgi:hypothetical protein